MRGCVLIILSWLGGIASLMANPDGAPWGSADPSSAQNCSSCHFDGEAVLGSEAISISFKKGRAPFDKPDVILLQFHNQKNAKVGFQIISSAGSFASSHADIEANGAQARSLALRNNPYAREINGTFGAVIWTLQWIPPEELDGDVVFQIAVNESNDDQSALGDKIHYKTVRISRPGDFWLLPHE